MLDKLLIATGASPCIPALPGIDRPAVMPLKSLEDGRAIQGVLEGETVQRVVILGKKGCIMLYKFDGKQPTVGKDTYVSDIATVIGDVVIGSNCYIGHGAILRADYGRIEIGDGTAIEEGVVVHAPPGDTNRIGRRVTIGHGAVVHGKQIGHQAVIGMGAILSIWSEIGEGAIVAEGSVVKLKQIIPPKVVAAGNPAQIVREVSAKDEEFWKWGKQLYVDLAKKYLDEGMEPVQ